MTSNRNLMQKTFLSFFALCVCVTSLFSQDIITPNNGKNFQTVVQENQPVVDYATFIQLRKDDKAMEAFLKENDDALYRQFNKGVLMRKKGKNLLGTGLGVTGAGIALMIIGGVQMSNGDTGEYYWSDITDEYEKVLDGRGAGIYVVGCLGVIVGQSLTVASIPFSAIGGSMKKRAANAYDQKYYRGNASHQPTINFIVTGNGVGFALNF